MPDFGLYFETLSQSGVKYLENEPLSRHSTFKIGGAARAYVMPKTASELSLAISAARACGVRTFVSGRASNLVYPDSGFDGAVISTVSMSTVSVNGTVVTAGAGTSLSELASAAQSHGLTGLEFCFGIPGSVGGAVYMNAGAYDGEIAGVIQSSTYYDAVGGTIAAIDREAHCFSYRSSVYKAHPERIITEATFSLDRGAPEIIREKMDELMARRREKQPLEYPSAGSVFKRVDGIPVARLIDEAGLKGTRVGGAEISEKHAGFIVNRGGATADDVLRLIEIVRKKIYELHGIDIECEVRRVGEE